MIKAKNACKLAQLDASDLALYKVSLTAIEVDSRLKEAITDSKGNSAVTRTLLPPLKKMKEVFPEPLQEDLVHIIFEHGPGKYSYFRRIYPKQLDKVLHPAAQTGRYRS